MMDKFNSLSKFSIQNMGIVYGCNLISCFDSREDVKTFYLGRNIDIDGEIKQVLGVDLHARGGPFGKKDTVGFLTAHHKIEEYIQ